jgi:hypothetical protein
VDALEILARLAGSGTPQDGESALIMSVGLDKTINRFENETLAFASAGGAELRFVFAPYGRGKTHFLWTLQEIAKKRGFVTAYLDCNSGHSPFASPQNTYQMIAANMTPPGRQMSSPVGTGADAVIEQAIILTEGRTSTQKLERVYRDTRMTCDFRNLAAAYGKVVSLGSHRDDIGAKLRALIRADPSYRIKVSELYRDQRWLPRPIGKLVRRNAAAWVRSLASLPIALGYPGLAIFFDETEQTLSLQSMSRKNRQVHLANLRNLVDHLALGSFHGCVIYYAVVEELLEIARRELDALRQRLDRVRFADGDHLRNPRAVWVDLDELTEPTPDQKEFFDELGKRILSLGQSAGIKETVMRDTEKTLRLLSEKYCNSISSGAVREFVKAAASHVAYGVTRNV